ncbi:polysaccharide lyase family 7 protein [Flavobacteriaceae bacterium]|nr:polysaccharide lyase family 7 protein [Flavobacteriaceae bacterium]
MQIKVWSLSLMLLLSISASCQNQEEEEPVAVLPEVSYKLPDIDLSTWKVTLPIGRPTEVLPPEILDYANVDVLKPFMYNDSIEGAIVFYTYPGATTQNTSYSRTELRELMDGGNGKVNWTFKQGGKMRGRLSVPRISKDEDGDYHRTIIMQIHGRLTDEQRELIGASSNNAPPMLKIYWTDGYVRVKTKVLKNLDADYEEILETDSWGDDEGFNFDTYVGFDPFELSVEVNEKQMIIRLNNEEEVVYEGIHIEKWNVFENYFKAGNYLGTLDSNAFSVVKYYELEVEH